jgi:hypothetical protein
LYRLFAPDFEERARRYRGVDLRVVIIQHLFCDFSEPSQFIWAQAISIVLREAINEEGSFTGTKENDAAITTGLAFSGAGNTLLVNATAQIGVDQTRLQFANRPAKRRIVNSVLAGKACEFLALENSQSRACGLQKFTITLSVIAENSYLITPRSLEAMKSAR